MGGVIIPCAHITLLDQPLIFLAGPMKGAPLWQDDAIQYILSQRSDIIVASPRKGIRPAIEQHIFDGEHDYFSRTRAWERHYIELAACGSQGGALLFWLPGEIEHHCDKSYGAMTRLELGQWMTRYNRDSSIRLCIGTDGHFSEFETIAYDLSLDVPDKKVHRTLEETCRAALDLIL